MVWIYADDLELTEWILIYKVMMNLGPTEANNLSVMNAEKETSGVEPRFAHSVFEVGHRPIALIGVGFKDVVIKFEPRFTMNFRIEGDELIRVRYVRNLCCYWAR